VPWQNFTGYTASTTQLHDKNGNNNSGNDDDTTTSTLPDPKACERKKLKRIRKTKFPRKKMSAADISSAR
jgi:hypothetical protein